MYTIEYNNLNAKPTLIKPELRKATNLKIYSSECEKYLSKKAVLDKTWNIRSVTIGKEDIKALKYAKGLNIKEIINLRKRYAKTKKDGITILNNNSQNEELIFEILNEDWLINEDDLNKFTKRKIKALEDKLEMAKIALSEIEEMSKKDLKNTDAYFEVKRLEYVIKTLKVKKTINPRKVLIKSTNM